MKRKIIFLVSKARLVRNTGKFTTICGTRFKAMWDSELLTTLQASTVCYGNSLTFLFQFIVTQDSRFAHEGYVLLRDQNISKFVVNV
jgi:hypothetical protein